MKIQELRSLSDEELKEKLLENKKAVQEMGFERCYGRVEKPHRFSLLRRDVARIKTVLKERKNEQ